MAETKQAASLMSIEELKQKLGVSDAVFEGTKAANGLRRRALSAGTPANPLM